jgi:ADP-ribose pyrophosphatase YjhB (NUDIX family)
MADTIRFCGYCGGPLARTTADRSRPTVLACETCGSAGVPAGYHCGPALLVLTQLFVHERILLMRRGTEPYKGRWAPPGGFVEYGESLETAAVREVWEEVRIRLDHTQLLPHAVFSIPKINQVYHVFNVHLSHMPPACAVAPESLEVAWFSEEDLARLDVWKPLADVGTGLLFEAVRAGRFDFHQYTDRFSRVITDRCSIRYLWKRS